MPVEVCVHILRVGLPLRFWVISCFLDPWTNNEQVARCGLTYECFLFFDSDVYDRLELNNGRHVAHEDLFLIQLVPVWMT